MSQTYKMLQNVSIAFRDYDESSTRSSCLFPISISTHVFIHCLLTFATGILLLMHCLSY